MTDATNIFWVLGALSLVIALISAVRLVQRLRAKRHVSAAAFALRLALSCWFVWFFASLLWMGK